KGVTLAVENCEPGEDVKFVVNPEGDSNVTAYENTVNADDEGKASVNVYGTSSDASAYIGDYAVTVTCGDAELTGEFSVSDDANAGGSDGDEDGSGNADGGEAGDGGDLPRTGTELTGLVGGAGLLLIGGISVALTMRRKKTPEEPSEIGAVCGDRTRSRERTQSRLSRSERSANPTPGFALRSISRRRTADNPSQGSDSGNALPRGTASRNLSLEIPSQHGHVCTSVRLVTEL